MVTEFTKLRIMVCYENMWEFVDMLKYDEELLVDEEKSRECIQRLKTIISREYIAIPETILSKIFGVIEEIEEIIMEDDIAKMYDMSSFLEERMDNKSKEEDFDEAWSFHRIAMFKLSHIIAKFGQEVLRPYLVEDEKIIVNK